MSYFRFFFKKFDGIICEQKSSIRERLIADNVHGRFEALNSKGIDWAHFRYPDTELPLVGLPLPPAKRKKTVQ